MLVSLNVMRQIQIRLFAVFMQVKKIMEESVTKKFVHEDSGSVTLLCGE